MSQNQNNIDTDRDYRDIPVEEIFYDEKFNCRGKPDPMTCKKLAEDILQNGLMQAIVVQSHDKIAGKKWRILCGHRRFIAMVDWNREPTIPCKINHNQMSEEDALIYNLSENMQRESLTIMQEANSVRHLFAKNYGARAAADKLNLSYGWVQVRFMLLQLSGEVQDMADKEMLTQHQIRDFYSMKNDEARTSKFIMSINASKKNGAKHAVSAKIKGKETKRIRNKTEMIDLQSFIARQLGHGLTTRALAWAQGGITDGEVLESVREACEAKGVEYIQPVEGSLA